jgi:phosphoglucomutase
VTKKGKDGAEQIQALMAGFRTNRPTEMNGIKVVKVVDVKESKVYDVKNGTESPLKMDKSNVIQFYLEDGSKISARPSGTEPKIKYYFSVNQPLPDKSSYKKVEAALEARLEGLKAYFS